MVAATAGVTHKDTIDLDQIRPFLAPFQKFGTDAAGAHDGDTDRPGQDRRLAKGRRFAQRRLGTAGQGGDRNRHPVIGGVAHGLVLHHREGDLQRLVPGQGFIGLRGIADGGGVGVIDGIDVLEQAYRQIQRFADEDGGQVGTAAAQQDRLAGGIFGDIAWHHDQVSLFQVTQQDFRLHGNGIGVQVLALGDQADLGGRAEARDDARALTGHGQQGRRAHLAGGDQVRRRRRHRGLGIGPGQAQQLVGLALEGGDDGDDLVGVADIAVDFGDGAVQRRFRGQDRPAKFDNKRGHRRFSLNLGRSL